MKNLKTYVVFSFFCFTFIVNLHLVLCSNVDKTIYITSDDGPLQGTKNIIEVVTKRKVPITMFMVGLHYDSGGSKLKQTVIQAKKNPFVEIGNHSYSHANNHYKYFYKNPVKVVDNFKKNNITLGLTGNRINARLPGRNVFRLPNVRRNDPYILKQENNVEVIDEDALYKNNFYLYGWDLEWDHFNDGKPIQSVNKLVKEIENKFIKKSTILPNKLILLMHDEMFQDHFNGKNNLENLIDTLQKKKYKFDFIKNYDS